MRLPSLVFRINKYCIFRPYLNEQVLDLEHQRIVESAMTEFDSRKKLGGEEFSQKYRSVGIWIGFKDSG